MYAEGAQDQDGAAPPQTYPREEPYANGNGAKAYDRPPQSESRESAPRGNGPPAPTPSNVLGVFGLSIRTVERDLEEEFGRSGEVEKVVIVYDQRSSRSRGFGFVTMKTQEDAERCIKDISGMELHGRTLRVDYSATKRPHEPTPGEYRGPRRPDEYPRDGRGGGGSYRGNYRGDDRWAPPPGRDDRYGGGGYSDRYAGGGGGGYRDSRDSYKEPARDYRDGGYSRGGREEYPRDSGAGGYRRDEYSSRRRSRSPPRESRRGYSRSPPPRLPVEDAPPPAW